MSSTCLTQCFGNPTKGGAIGNEIWTRVADKSEAQEKRPRSPDESPGKSAFDSPMLSLGCIICETTKIVRSCSMLFNRTSDVLHSSWALAVQMLSCVGHPLRLKICSHLSSQC